MHRYPIAKHSLATALLALVALASAVPAHANGEIQITHAKALAGNVTPGDTPGYPVTLSIPGSFELASNLFVAAGKIGIQVTGANVTIDLNGFTMEGSNVAWYGVVGGVDNVTVKDGTIRDFDFDGIHAAGHYWTVDSVKVLRNGRDGVVSPAGRDFRIVNSTVSFNLARGIRCAAACHVEGNTVSSNGAIGINVSSGTVLGNTIFTNHDEGIALGNGGYGNNTLIGNNAFGAQISGSFFEMHSNACNPPSGCPAVTPP